MTAFDRNNKFHNQSFPSDSVITCPGRTKHIWLPSVTASPGASPWRPYPVTYSRLSANSGIDSDAKEREAVTCCQRHLG